MHCNPFGGDTLAEEIIPESGFFGESGGGARRN